MATAKTEVSLAIVFGSVVGALVSSALWIVVSSAVWIDSSAIIRLPVVQVVLPTCKALDEVGYDGRASCTDPDGRILTPGRR